MTACLQRAQSSDDITEAAIAASINCTELGLQQTAFMAGRGSIMKISKQVSSSQHHPVRLYVSEIRAGAKVNETEQPLSNTQSAA